MRCIFYDGNADGAAQAAKASRAGLVAEGEKVRTRDATTANPAALERFDAVLIPAGETFDALAAAYADSGAEVARSAAPTKKSKSAAAGDKKEP
jgi:enamine deaminase RidA (YjgF/YER057c/UK114 family)